MTSDDEPLLDRLRAWADGALTPEEARALEARLAADPALACDALAYRAVHRLTQPLVAEVELSRLRFADLPLGDRVRPAWRRWPVLLAAAAGMLLAVGLGLRARGGPPEPARPGTAPSRPGPVMLARLKPSAPPAVPPARLLAGYRPVADGRVSWLGDAAEARALARATGRRVLLYVQHPECPMCRALEQGPWRAPEVLARVEAFVPLQVDVTSLPPAEMQRHFEAGWPYLAATDAEGVVVATFPGQHASASLAEALGAARPAGAPEPEAWERAAGRARTEADEREAALALAVARAAALPGAAERERLRALRARLAGTPPGEDLERVLAAWPEGAPFPTLVEPDR